MTDGQRVYPVEYHFLHHSVGPEFYNADPITVQDWFSTIGKSRGYNNGAINPMHEHPSRPGQITYAMAHFALYRYDKDGNKYGWKLIDLIKNPYANVAWSVGNWWYNQRSVSTEVCGNYLNQILPDKALMLLADYMRPIDKELGGKLQVWLHQEVFATACPGRIKEQRNKLVDMINNPKKWNDTIWPPKPVITTKEVTEIQDIDYTTERIEDSTLEKGHEVLIQSGKKGVRTIVYTVTYKDGKETSRKVKSSTVTTAPESTIIMVGTKEPTVAPEPGGDDDILSWLQALWQWVKDILSKFRYNK